MTTSEDVRRVRRQRSESLAVLFGALLCGVVAVVVCLMLEAVR